MLNHFGAYIRKTTAMMCVAATGLSASVAGAAADDHAAFKDSYQSVQMFNATPGTIYLWTNGTATISSSSDVDYITLMCRGDKVKTASITFKDSDGDLDIKVYDLDGKSLGGGTSTTNNETVNVASKNLTGVVIKVYGYQGATNKYSLSNPC